MSEMYVDPAVLGSIADGLDNGATGLDDLAGSVPSGVDAGMMTGVVASMLAQVTDSAGTVSTSMSAAATLVRQCRTYYQRADADAAAGLSEIREAVQP